MALLPTVTVVNVTDSDPVPDSLTVSVSYHDSRWAIMRVVLQFGGAFKAILEQMCISYLHFKTFPIIVHAIQACTAQYC